MRRMTSRECRGDDVQGWYCDAGGTRMSRVRKITYVAGNYVVGNYVAEVCGNLRPRRWWRGVNGHRVPSATAAGLYRHRPSPPPPGVVCRFPSITRSPPSVILIMYTYHLSSLSSSYVIFPSTFITCDYSCRKIFFILPNYNYYFRESSMIRSCVIVSRGDDARVIIRCREEGTINADTDIFILDIYFSCNTLYTILFIAYIINSHSMYEFYRRNPTQSIYSIAIVIYTVLT